MATERRPWPHDPRFLVGDDGSIRGPSGRVLRPGPNSNGYQRIAIGSRGHRVRHFIHVIVCETFHGPRPDGHEAAHLNGDHLDCRAVNLAWKTHTENEADKVRHGTHNRGESHYGHRLTVDRVREIRASPEPGTVLAGRHGVSETSIRDVRAGRTWRWLV